MTAGRLLFVLNEDWYYQSHYRSWALRAQEAGYDVHAAMRIGQAANALAGDPIELHPLKTVQRGGLNPLQQLRLIRELIDLYRDIEPDIVHHVTLRTVFCGSVAARIAGVPKVVNAVTGLGYVFVQPDCQSRLVRFFVLRVLKHLLSASNSRFILSNPEDRQELLRRGVVNEKQVVMVPGSGIDPGLYPSLEEPDDDIPVVMLPSRMLRPKGVEDFVAAAQLLEERGIQCRMVLVGDTDQGNPSAIPRETLEGWQVRGPVEWWGHSPRIVESFRKASIVCLPSYREGLPRVLLEASSCGRAVIATDVPGCREICRHGVNGLLVRPRDPAALADAIERLVEDGELRRRYGERGRQLVIERFSLTTVTDLVLAAYSDLLRNASTP